MLSFFLFFFWSNALFFLHHSTTTKTSILWVSYENNLVTFYCQENLCVERCSYYVSSTTDITGKKSTMDIYMISSCLTRVLRTNIHCAVIKANWWGGRFYLEGEKKYFGTIGPSEKELDKSMDDTCLGRVYDIGLLIFIPWIWHWHLTTSLIELAIKLQ